LSEHPSSLAINDTLFLVQHMPTANEIFKKFLNNILFQGYLVTNEDKEKNIALDKSFIFILSKAEL